MGDGLYIRRRVTAGCKQTGNCREVEALFHEPETAVVYVREKQRSGTHRQYE